MYIPTGIKRELVRIGVTAAGRGKLSRLLGEEDKNKLYYLPNIFLMPLLLPAWNEGLG
jgi:hypothetical protein